MTELLSKLMNLNYVELAIPLFLILPLAECLWGRRSSYRLNDSLNSLTCGVMQQLFGVYLTGLMIYWYDGLEKKLGVFAWEEQSLVGMACAWLGFYVLVDFFYYWFHRFAHVVNIGWAAHVVHHQSEEYNLVTALRQAVVQTFFSQFFYWPLALIGAPVGWLISLLTLNFVYQFWIHTQEIQKMPRWFEAVFNTPSHHRVHHATNLQYLDKNFAGTFIIWDRMFGTFEPESAPAVYGIVSPLESWNPLWAQIHYFVYLIRASLRVKGWGAKVAVWFMSPSRLADSSASTQSGSGFAKYDPPVSQRNRIIAIFSFGMGMGVTLLLLEYPTTEGILRLGAVVVAVGFLTISGWSLDSGRQPLRYTRTQDLFRS